jgi:hypothetical protein
MSDTKRMEMVAENLIAHFLQRHNLLVAKPHFDQEGGDLYALTTNDSIRFCRIQCKGRTVRPGQGNNVKISKDLNLKSLVVCLFVDDGTFENLNIFVFFQDDIMKWETTPDGSGYVLSLSYNTLSSRLGPHRVTEQTIERIANEIMSVELPTSAQFKFTASGGVEAGGEAGI